VVDRKTQLLSPLPWIRQRGDGIVCDMLCESLGAFCVDVTSLYQDAESVHENSAQGCNSLINFYEHEALIQFVRVPLRRREYGTGGVSVSFNNALNLTSM
jgi:hypothetical protein